jgi:hypothetical protein
MSISIKTITGLVLLCTTLSACNAEKTDKVENIDAVNTQKQAKVPELKMVNDMQEVDSAASNEITLKGQVLFQEMEGGFFGFIDDKGKKYTPVGMNKDYLRHGLVIELSGTLLPNMITITQFGEVIKVSKVVILDESKALKPGRPNIDSNEL